MKILEKIKELIHKKLDVKMVTPGSPTVVNICNEVSVAEDIVNN